METPQYQRRREDTPCEPVEWSLNKDGLLDWLNHEPIFSTKRFHIRDALLVGRPVEHPTDLRLVLVLEHLQTNRLAYAPFEFAIEALRPFLQSPVIKQHQRGQ